MQHREIAEGFSRGWHKGNGSRIFIDGDTIYSYGHHFPIAKRLSNGGYLFNSNGYSSSTSTHKSYVRRALYGKEVYECPNCEVNRIPQWLFERINDLHDKILKAKSRLKHYIEELEGIGEYWQKCKEKFSLSSEDVEFALLFKNKEQIKAKLVAWEFDQATRKAA